MTLMRRLRAGIARHPVLSGTTAFLGLAVAVFVLAYFEPQKLFIDDRVDEAPPAAPARVKGVEPVALPATRVVAAGSFRSHEHSTKGTAQLLELANAKRFLRFEDFRTSNGPDVRVYLSKAAADGPGDAFDDDYVELGELKGNIGNQNYAIPAGVDLDEIRSAVVWCKRFSVAFGAAPLR